MRPCSILFILAIIHLALPLASANVSTAEGKSAMSSAPAENDEENFVLPSRLSWSYGIGSSESQNIYMDSELPFFWDSRLAFGLGGTWGKASTGYVQTNSTRFSLNTDPLADLGASLGYERWGEASVIETETFRSGVSWAPSGFLVALDYEYRTINWLSQSRGAGPERIYAFSHGVGGKISTKLMKSLSVSVSGMSWDYRDGPSSFDDLAVTGFISEPSLNQTSGFLLWQAKLGLSYFMSDWSLGASYSKIKTKLDDASGDSANLRADYSPFKGWSWGGLLSRSFFLDSESNPSYYGELSVGYSWQ